MEHTAQAQQHVLIQTEDTPNPLTMKFVPGVEVLASGSQYFTHPDMAERSPLAQALFMIEGVNAVFFGQDFITVTRAPEHEWDVLKAPILSTVMEHFVAQKPVLLPQEEGAAPHRGHAGAQTLHEAPPVREEDAAIVAQIKELIETHVQPAVAMDGGNIVFHSYVEGVVYLEMHGACAGCPSSTLTLKQGIENMLKHYIPEIEAVEPVAA